MKIFAVFARIHLTRQPEWLDDFRLKYDKPYELHITLKQPCWLEPDDLPDVQQKLARFFDVSKDIPFVIEVSLEQLAVNPDGPDGVCVMINTEQNLDLINLQKNIVAALDPYREYFRSESKSWEEHFTPHITIARALSPAVWQEAQRHMTADTLCVGTISEIVLVAVDRFDPGEAYKPENLTVYHL